MEQSYIAFALLICGLYATFNSLFIVCDNYLIPAVGVFITAYNVPEEIAAVTWIAFGSASPELFLNSISAASRNSDLSLAAILGSGMIAFGLIPPLALSLVPFVLGPGKYKETYSDNVDSIQLSTLNNGVKSFDITLKIFPILRECCFYILGLLLFLCTIYDGSIEMSESLVIIGAYVAYLFFILRGLNRNKPDEYPNDKEVEGKAFACSTTSTPTTILEASMDYESITSSSDSETDSSISFHSLSCDDSKDLTQLPSQRLEDDEEHGEIKDHSRRKRHSRYFDCLTDSSVNSDFPDVEAALKGTLVNEEVAELISHAVSSSRCEHPSQLLLTRPEQEDVDPPTSPHNRRTLLRCVTRTARMLHFAASSPLETFFSAVFPSLHSPHPPARRTLASHEARPLQRLLSRRSSKLHLQQQQFALEQQAELRRESPLWRAVSVLLLSMLFIALLTSLVVFISTSLVKALRLDSSTVGATLVALGSEVPDCINSIALARAGYFDGAIAGAIGSQVINITIGVGLPALVFSLSQYLVNDTVLALKIPQKDADSLFLLTWLLLVVIVSYLAVVTPWLTYMTRVLGRGDKVRIRSALSDKTTLTPWGAALQIVVLIVVYIVFITTNESNNIAQ